MSESIRQTPEFTPAHMELVDAARDFVQQPGSVLIKYPDGSQPQNLLTWVRAGRTADGGVIIVHIDQYFPPNLPYDPDGYSWDEYIHAELLTKTGEHTGTYAVRRANGEIGWYPHHSNEVDGHFLHEWQRTGGANPIFSNHDFEVTDEQLRPLTAAIMSPETLTHPEATETARDYFLRVYGHPRKN